MKVQGTQQVINRVDVEIDPVDVIRRIQVEWRRKVEDLEKGADYINREGFWESWDDTGHGSGITRVYRKATAEEIEASKAFDLVREIASGRK